MPIYEYVCEACGRLTEVIQKVSDPPPPACSECGESRLARLVSRTSFQLKGGGWYADLYSSAGKTKADAEGVSPGKGKPPAAPEAGGDKPGGDKPGGDKPGAAKSGGDKSTAEKASPGKSGGTGG